MPTGRQKLAPPSLGRHSFAGRLRTRAGVQRLLARSRRRLAFIGWERLIVIGLALVLLGAGTFRLLQQREVSPTPSATDFSSMDAAVWWSIVTLLTAGQGDVPRTPIGRLLASVGTLVCLVAVPALTRAAGEWMGDQRVWPRRKPQQIKHTDHVVICGWNRRIEQVVRGLLSVEALAPDAIVLVNDAVVDSEKLIRKFTDIDVRHIPGDFVQESVLRRSNVGLARSVIILASTDDLLRGADERALRAALAIRSLAPDLAIVVELLDQANEWHLRIADADDVVVVSEHLPFLLASAALTPGLQRLVRDLLTHASGASITRAALPVEYVGRRFAELAQYYRNEDCAILIGFIKGMRPAGVVLNPWDDYEVEANDLPIIIPRARPRA